MLASRAHCGHEMRILEFVRFLRREPFCCDVRQVPHLAGEWCGGLPLGGRHQVPQCFRLLTRPTVDGDALDFHRHVASVALECPVAHACFGFQSDSEAVPAEFFVNYVWHSAHPNGVAVERKPRRPLMFAHRLMQQYECLKDR